jgi:hypothetical protein
MEAEKRSFDAPAAFPKQPPIRRRAPENRIARISTVSKNV